MTSPVRIWKTVGLTMALSLALAVSFAPLIALAEQQLAPMNQLSQTVPQQQQTSARPTLEDVSSINHIEDQLYGSHDQAEAFEARLARIEQTMFGQTRPQIALRERLNWIYSTFNNAHPAPAKTEAAPADDAFYAPQQQAQQQQNGYYAPQQQQQPDATDYPAITALEQKIFGRTFVGQNINQRLEALEMATFQTVQRGALADRLENLQLLVFGDTQQRQVSTVTPTAASNYNYNPYNNFPQQGQNAYGQPAAQTQNVPYQPTNMANSTSTNDMIAATTQLEQQLFKQTYVNEPLTARLDRIEGKLFNGTSPEMAEADRLDRILAVSAGGGDKQGIASSSKKKDMMGIVLPIVFTILLGLL